MQDIINIKRKRQQIHIEKVEIRQKDKSSQ